MVHGEWLMVHGEKIARKFGSSERMLYFCNMNARRDKVKAQNAEMNKQLEPVKTEVKPVTDQRKEKLANYLIDVSKYVFTGVVITSLFNDVTDRTLLYFLGMIIVLVTLMLGLRLTNKRKEK